MPGKKENMDKPLDVRPRRGARRLDPDFVYDMPAPVVSTAGSSTKPASSATRSVLMDMNADQCVDTDMIHNSELMCYNSASTLAQQK